MTAPLADSALDQLFRNARSHNGWQTDSIAESTLRQIYELARMGPTAANSSPARFVFVTSAEAKEKLASVSSGNNQPKIKTAPATVIVGYDLDFPEHLPTLFPRGLGHEGGVRRYGGGRADGLPQLHPAGRPI